MNNGKYGLVSWDEVDTNIGGKMKKDNDKEIFLKMEDGPNKVRILTKPHQFMVHTYKEPGDQGWGFKVMCSKHHGRCVLCDKAEKYRASGDKEVFNQMKAKKRWLVGVIDRKTNSYKILDISYSIFSSLKDLNGEEAWGNPETYEINIKMNKNGGAAGFYTVLPTEKKPLSASDLEIKKRVAEELADDLVSRCQPPTPEAVESRLEGIKKYKDGQKKGGSTNQSQSTRNNAQSANQSQYKDSSDDDFDFDSDNV